MTTLRVERPVEATTDRVFVVLKGQRRGEPLSFEGLNQVFVSARERAGLRRITCHELRHTCFTRLREAGMELEALQAQAGHRSIETTRLYIHLANEWLAVEYHQAMTVIDADLFVDGRGRSRRMTTAAALAVDYDDGRRVPEIRNGPSSRGMLRCWLGRWGAIWIRSPCRCGQQRSRPLR